MEVEPDAELIAASLDDPERFGPLFDRHASVLYRYLIRRVGVDEAEGLLGDVFRIAFEKRSGYDPDRPDARPWLYGIATNLVAHRRRSEARRLDAVARLLGTVPTIDGAASGSDPTAERAAGRVDAEAGWPHIADAVAALPAGERDALLLYAWEDLSYAEIAEALAVPVGTVRSRLNRARAHLRELDVVSGR